MVAKTYRGAVGARDAGRGLFIWAYDRARVSGRAVRPGGVTRAARRRRLACRRRRRAPQGRPPARGAADRPGGDARRRDPRQRDRAVREGGRRDRHAQGVQRHAVRRARRRKAGRCTAASSRSRSTRSSTATTRTRPTSSAARPCRRAATTSRACAIRASTRCSTRGQRTYDLGAAQGRVLRLQRILHDEMPIALLYQRPEVDTFANDVRGQTTSLSTIWWNVAAWRRAP